MSVHSANSTCVNACWLLMAVAAASGNAVAMDKSTCPALRFDSEGKAPWLAHPKVAGVFIQYLLGRPTEAGLFKYRLQLPAGFVLGEHTHSGDLAMTVLCGTVLLTTAGNTAANPEKEWGRDSAHYFPGQSPHAEASTHGAVIEVIGIGPMTTQMLDKLR